MEALRKKWKSSRGASILMALLFLLVCMMVGASVLMSAVSNAGKLKSNREEQQKYLTLSSALTLICDELENVEYVGKYHYTRVLVDTWQIVGYDDKGQGKWDYKYDHDRHCYAQAKGTLRNSAVTDINPQLFEGALPLLQNLDALFAKKFVPPDPKWFPKDDYNAQDFVPLSNLVDPSVSYTVVLSLKDGDAYGGLKEEVTVKAEINGEGEITLTAALGGLDSEYIMEAKLVPDKKLENVLVLAKKPAAEVVPGEHQKGTTPLLSVDRDAGAENKTEPLTWKLDRIEKKEKG